MGFDGSQSRDTACFNSSKPGFGFLFETTNQLSHEIHEQTVFNGLTEGFHSSEQRPPGRTTTTPARERAISPKLLLAPRTRPDSSQRPIRHSLVRTLPLSRGLSTWATKKNSVSTNAVDALDFLFFRNELEAMERLAHAKVKRPENRTDAVQSSIYDRVQYAIGREKTPYTSIRENEDAINNVPCSHF